MPTKERYNLEHVEDALRRSAGILTAAAQILEAAYGSCSPRSVRNYINRYPRLRRVVEETVQTNLDLAESQIIKRIADGDLQAAIFYLRTKGRDRGYVFRVEATGPNGGPISHTVKHRGTVRLDPAEAYRQMLDGPSEVPRRGRPKLAVDNSK